jgi:transglutaminase/protease-like cytokinesis protein 3
MDPRVREVPDTIQDGIQTDPDRYLPELVAFLLAGADDDFHAVKRLHDWVTDNIVYDTERVVSGTVTAESVGLTNVLKSGLSVCAGYANVFQAMVEIADIEVETVSGYARGYSFDAFVAEDATATNHAWNAVRIDGETYLVDTTWDAGSSAADTRVFTPKYSTKYLFLAPEAFLHTHFPADPKWQLLEPPVSPEAFFELPHLKGRFFETGLQLKTPIARLNHVGSTTRIRLSIPEDKAAYWTLRSPNGTKQEGRTRVQETEDGEDLLVIFPEPGNWTVAVFVKDKQSTGSYAWAAEFAFNASEGSALRFPD